MRRVSLKQTLALVLGFQRGAKLQRPSVARTTAPRFAGVCLLIALTKRGVAANLLLRKVAARQVSRRP